MEVSTDKYGSCDACNRPNAFRKAKAPLTALIKGRFIPDESLNDAFSRQYAMRCGVGGVSDRNMVHCADGNGLATFQRRI